MGFLAEYSSSYSWEICALPRPRSWSCNPHYRCGKMQKCQSLVALRECFLITLTLMAITKPGRDCFGKSQWQNLAPATERQVNFGNFEKIWMEQIWVNNKFLQTIYWCQKLQVRSSLMSLGVLKWLGEQSA